MFKNPFKQTEPLKVDIDIKAVDDLINRITPYLDDQVKKQVAQSYLKGLKAGLIVGAITATMILILIAANAKKEN